MTRSGALRAILTGGAAAGAGDITYAFVFYWFRNGAPPARILQSVASGLLGRPAYAGGAGTALLGLALHFLIAFSIAAVYVAAAARMPVLARRPLACGAAYGVLAYAFMNLVVVPLSRFPNARAFPPDVLLTGLAAHVFLIGIPIAFAARRVR